MRHSVTIVAAICLTLVALGANPGAGGLAQGPAVVQAATCSGTGCDNTNPITTDCWAEGGVRVLGAAINNQYGGQIGEVYVDYSTTCKTKFVEVISYIYSNYVSSMAESKSGWSRQSSSSSVSDVFSPQYYSPQGQNCSGRGSVRGTGFIDQYGGSSGQTITNWYC